MAELVSPVALCTSAGRLNPAAVGWSRRPLHTANLADWGRGWGRTKHRGWGRNKRWEYWALVTPRHILTMTVSSLDYAGVHSIYVLDRRSGTERTRSTVEPLARSAMLPDRCGEGVARARAGGLSLSFSSGPAGTQLRAEAPGISIAAHVGPGHDCLAVVVPWSVRRFQYTVKDVGRPTAGTFVLDGEEYRFGGDGSFAVLDHGRGRWPYLSTWNWAAGFGVVGGRHVGLQLGGRWTDGTGSTENGLFVDGRLHKIEADLEWHYDRTDWMQPWRIRGPRVEVTFAPFHERAQRMNLVLVGNEVHQCFGRFTGYVLDDTAHRVQVDGLVGWAEEARNRW